MPIHINIEDLFSARTVESDRIEFKQGWNPDAIYRSICAFANDFENIGGGYIVIGVEENEETRTAIRPVKGLSTKEIAEIQTKMIGFNNLIINHGGPDRSIQLELFNQGRVRSRRYRNRRLGEFLKELELTEGRATGIPTVFKTLAQNGSPKPRFFTDDDHTFLEVELFIHPEFEKKESFTVDVATFERSLEGIDKLLNRLLEYYELNKDENLSSDQAKTSHSTDNESTNIITLMLSHLMSDQASDQADKNELVDNEQIATSKEAMNNRLSHINSDQANKLITFIREVVGEKERIILFEAQCKSGRSYLLEQIELSNHTTNFQRYIISLVELGWLSMTNPDKPTSPNQKYVTTLKGLLLSNILEKNKS